MARTDALGPRPAVGARARQGLPADQRARPRPRPTKAPFAELFARPERRCLVLADGWYEWLKAEKKGGARIPFRYTVDERRAVRVRRPLGPPPDRRRADPLGPASSPARPTRVCAPVHDRMPCVLAGPDEEAAWLAGESEGLLAPLDAERTAVAPANPAVNKAGVEGAELLTPPPPERARAAQPGHLNGCVWQGSPGVNEGQVALIVGVLLAAGLAASLAAGRLRMPGLVLVLGIGMLIGSDGLELINFDDFEVAQQVGRHRARLHPLRGRPVGGLRRDPAGAQDVDSARDAGHASARRR